MHFDAASTPALDDHRPLVHSMHTSLDWPASLKYFPATHEMHFDDASTPVDDDHVPAAHPMHLSAPIPISVEYFPDAQPMHTPSLD